MKLDLSKLQNIVASNHELAVRIAFGDNGTNILRRMHTILRDLYAHLEAELISGQLILMAPIDALAQHSEIPYREIANLASDLSAHLRSESALIMLGHDGNISWNKSVTANPEALSDTSIVYQYQNRCEIFFVKGVPKVIENPSALHVSIFAIPTFIELEDALDDYRRRFIRTSTCMIFQGAWHTPQRLIFRNKPEETMRNSLCQFLKITLRDAEVRPESVVDTSHPVDIKVTWMLTTRLALIEIKWVGKSIATGSGTTDYSDARARAGAKQLERYLDANAQQAPMHTARGYLVVIDGRRRGVNRNSTQVNLKNGMYYAHRELDYDRPTSTDRVDFAEPVRMFAEPICSPN